MNPFTALLIITDDIISDILVEGIFLVVRGFIVPSRDVIEVSLICLMLRVQIKATHRKMTVHKGNL